jgi:hypothetical protein
MPLFNERLIDQIRLNQVSDLQIESTDPALSITKLCQLLRSAGPQQQNTAITRLRLKYLSEPIVSYLGRNFNYVNLTALMLEGLTSGGISVVASTLAMHPNLQTLGLKGLDGTSTRVLLSHIQADSTHLTHLEVGALDEEGLTAVVTFLANNHQVKTLVIDALEKMYMVSFSVLIANAFPWIQVTYTESAMEILQVAPATATLIDSTDHQLPSFADAEQNDSFLSLLSSDNVSATANDHPFDFLSALNPENSANESPNVLSFEGRVETSASTEAYVSSNNAATSSSSSSSSSSARPSQHGLAATGNDDAAIPIFQEIIRNLTTQNNLLKISLSASEKRYMDLMEENAQLKEELGQRSAKRSRKSDASSVSRAGLFSSSSGAGISTLQSLNFAPSAPVSPGGQENVFFAALSSAASGSITPRVTSNKSTLPLAAFESEEFQLEGEEQSTFAAQARR